ncbi:MAG: hypothetical protein ACRBFS_24920 [Aureispira sp.]
MPPSNLLLALLYLTAFSSTLLAQTTPKSILNNPDITWVAEAYTHYVPSENSSNIGRAEMKTLYEVDEWNSAQPLKMINDLGAKSLYGAPKSLAALMLSINASKVSIYETAALKNRYSKQVYQEIKNEVDTLIVFDPETFEEIVLVLDVLKEEYIKVFKVKQLLYYNSKTKQLGALPVAIAPMLTMVSSKGSVKEHRPIFWMGIQDMQTPFNQTNDAYHYAIRMARNISEEDMKLIKGEGSLVDLTIDMIEDGKQHAQDVEFYHPMGDLQRMTATDVLNFGKSLDTISVFDPEVFGERIEVVGGQFRAKEVRSIRLVQDWAWNRKEQQLYIRLVAYAPIRHPYDGIGEKANYPPYFYKKPRE